MMTAAKVSALVQAEISRVEDHRIQGRMRKFSVSPRPVDGSWDYGKPDQTYVCWIVLENPESGRGIAYCEEGFGPTMPWGLMELTGPNRYRMGMDAQWHDTLAGAFRESWMWEDLSP